jgi:hypothetical protein
LKPIEKSGRTDLLLHLGEVAKSLMHFGQVLHPNVFWHAGDARFGFVLLFTIRLLFFALFVRLPLR